MTGPPIVVTRQESGRTLAAILKDRLRVSWSRARQIVEQSQVRINGQSCRDSARRVAAGQRIEFVIAGKARGRTRTSKPPTPVRATPSTVKGILVRYADSAVVVVEKPSGLTTMRHPTEAAEFGPRGRRFLPKTLADDLPGLLGGGGPVRAVHRLDRSTSGLVVFARTAEAEQHLGQQFRAHTVARRYLAIVRGQPPVGRIESWLVGDRGDGRRGSDPAGTGQRAVTHVKILEVCGDCSLVECRLETGRTHQVRIHLGEAGAPLAGESVYDRPIHGQPWPDPSGAPRLALHAAILGFAHPISGVWMEWESPLPPDLTVVLERLRTPAKPRG